MLKKNNFGGYLINTLKTMVLDPVLIYTVLIMMTVMYHYRSSLTLIYGLSTLFLGSLIFKLFKFIEKHKFVGSIVYIILFGIIILFTNIFIDRGRATYPISFGIWFLTPQDALDYSKWYTLAMYLLFMFFMTSVIYYFTRIRYRIFMNFLIFIIPFAIYGKEYEKMPTVFVMLLAIGYIVIMINCRQISEDNSIKIIGKANVWKSVAVYIVIFASISAVIPKPTIKADREVLEELISADELTDRLLAAVNVFRDTSSSTQFQSLTDETILYFVSSSDDLRLKTLTFSSYNYKTDEWSVNDDDTKFDYTSDDRSIEFPKTWDILDAISIAAQKDKNFSEKYGLENFNTNNIVPSQIKEVKLYTVGQKAQYAPIPSGATKLIDTTYDKTIAVIRSGLLYCADNYFSSNETFTFEYCEDSFFDNEENKRLVDLMSRDDYYDLIYDAAYILAYNDDAGYEILSDDYWESQNFDEIYLDYGKNGKIYNLANEITSGIDNDYDKAKAIESYFSINNYIYDLNYKKSKGENAENFIFETKRGVCYEYATAMVLLARAAGIPARYAEGYNMYEKYDNSRLNTNYVIKSKAAHGFPELYIRGAGWISFEPTVSNMMAEEPTTTASTSLSHAGLFLIFATILFLVILKIYPIIVHRMFLIKIDHLENDEAVITTVKRIYNLCKLSSNLTVHEAVNAILIKYNVDIIFTAELFDKIVYGEQTATIEEKNKAVEEYMIVYRAQKEEKKTKLKH